MSNSPQRPKVSLDDLLHLKRAERPAPEFWTSFERELRQKQLAALLEKRPWWREMSQLLARRSYLPIGATAILAFTLVSIKYYAPVQLAQAEGPAIGLPVASGQETASPAEASTPPVSSPQVNRTAFPAASPLDDRTPGSVARTEIPAEIDPSQVSMPLLAAPPTVETPSSRSIAANLANLEQSEPELINAVAGNRLSAPARAQAASLQLSELPSMPTNASKRNRILAQYSDRQLTPEPSAPEIFRERLSRKLGDPEITDRINRVGVRGDSFSVRF